MQQPVSAHVQDPVHGRFPFLQVHMRDKHPFVQPHVTTSLHASGMKDVIWALKQTDHPPIACLILNVGQGLASHGMHHFWEADFLEIVLFKRGWSMLRHNNMHLARCVHHAHYLSASCTFNLSASCTFLGGRSPWPSSFKSYCQLFHAVFFEWLAIIMIGYHTHLLYRLNERLLFFIREWQLPAYIMDYIEFLALSCTGHHP